MKKSIRQNILIEQIKSLQNDIDILESMYFEETKDLDRAIFSTISAANYIERLVEGVSDDDSYITKINEVSDMALDVSSEILNDENIVCLYLMYLKKQDNGTLHFDEAAFGDKVITRAALRKYASEN